MKKILFVDDEPNVLSALQRQLYNRYRVETAVGPQAGLAALANWRDYAVVVADMAMPEMNGVEFLTKVKELAPDIVRVMLTGYANQAIVIEAINHGNIFRFLNKPCSAESLVETLDASLRQNQLITAERDLLEKTFGGSLKVLTELLAMTDPRRFGNAETLRDNIRVLAEKLNIKVTWELEAAAMLSQIGSVTIPPELTLKVRLGHTLSANEKGNPHAHPGDRQQPARKHSAPGRSRPHHSIPEQTVRRPRISRRRRSRRGDSLGRADAQSALRPCPDRVQGRHASASPPGVTRTCPAPTIPASFPRSRPRLPPKRPKAGRIQRCCWP